MSTGYQDPQIFVPGNHSGFANLVPGNPATVDEPALDNGTAVTSTAGTLVSGTTYDYAVTDQFTAAPVSPTLGIDGESAADLTGPITVDSPDNAISIQWQAICHAANYNIYRATCSNATCTPTPTSWALIGNYTTPFSSTLPNNSSGDATPPNPNSVTGAGQTELTFTDNGTGTGPGGSQCEDGGTTPPGYCATAGPAPWTTPPVTENAEETPWEQNPYFIPALQGAGITAVGDDGSKPYPDPPTATFFPDDNGAGYSGPEYAAGQTFLEGTPTSTWPGAQVVPRHPINIYYNASTDAEELDEYNTLFTPESAGGQCIASPTTTCDGPGFSYANITDSIVSQMFQFVLQNNPEPSYVHQTNIIGILPGCSDTTWASNPDTCETAPSTTCVLATCMPTTAPATGDGTLYSVLNPLLAEYNNYFGSGTPYVQLTEGQIATILANQSQWSTTEATLTSTAADVTASETNGTVTITNKTNGALEVPVTAPNGAVVNGQPLQGPGGTSYNGSTTYGSSYGGNQSGWVNLPGGSTETVTLQTSAPTITSAATATSTVGTPFSFIVTATGNPEPTFTESGALPSGITFADNGNGTATISGTSVATTGGSYPLTITATSSQGTATQAFTLANDEGVVGITSAATATFATGVAGTYNITTTGYPITLSDGNTTLPAGLSFVDNGNGTGTISGTPTAATSGAVTVPITAFNSVVDESVTLDLALTVNTAAAPTITSLNSADFWLNQAGSVAITTTGAPTPAITETGTLPAGLTFVDNKDGTATLAGTPTVTGTYNMTIGASNGIGTPASQAFTLLVGSAPAFTSADATSFTVGTAGSFTVTTSGYPAPGFGWSNVPPGMTFTDLGNGTATLAGTPTTAGTYAMALTAGSAYGTADQTLTVTVGQSPTITSANNATFTVGTAGSFTVTSAGNPNAAITETGPYLPGSPWSATATGRALLSGTPTTGAGGSYPITITANNGVGTAATQSFTLTVDEAPAFTSANTTTFSVGTAGTFAVSTTGYPNVVLSETGSLPTGVTFVDTLGSNTATLSGTPASGTSGSYPITITSSNGVGTAATQSFTLVVGGSAPSITTANNTTFTVGTAGSFSVTATGSPTLALSESGTLPSGVVFTDDESGNGILGGTPAAGTGGSYPITITASNGITPNATQSFTLTVAQAPAFTSSNLSQTVTVGTPFTFTVGATGSPSPTISETGTVPTGLTFSDPAGGTATISGTPTGTGGVYTLQLTASNGIGTSATEVLTITVDAPPAITSGASDTFAAGKSGSFSVSATGYPTPSLTDSGTLPSGVTFTPNSNGTATLQGTPAAGTQGTYTIGITASNGISTAATQSFTLTVNSGLAITSGSSLTLTAGQATNLPFTITTTGTPAPTLTHTGTLPSGVTFTANTTGTATLSGTPAATASGIYPITFTAKNSTGTVSQSFTLTVDQAPTFSSAATATETAGVAFSFVVTAKAYPTPTVALSAGTLPTGVTFTPNSNGTGTLAGTTTGAATASLTFSASNGATTVTQSFTLTIKAAGTTVPVPTFTSPASTTFTSGKSSTFTVTTLGYPTTTYTTNVTHSGTLPAGVSFNNNGNGSATISGTPTAASVGTYPITLTAKNSAGTVTESFVLTVQAQQPSPQRPVPRPRTARPSASR